MKYKKLSTILTVVIFTFGVALILMMTQVSSQMKSLYEKNVTGIDLVIGAKGSPLQMVLASVYHSDLPTGNMSVEIGKRWYEHRLVKKAIPLSYGDSYEGYRIIGTEHSYIEHYGGEYAEGRQWESHLEIVVGYRVAKDLGIKIGDEIFSTHGLDETGHKHDKVAFKVVGILKENHSVLDQIIISDIPSVWIVHDPEMVGARFKHWTNYPDKELTAMLLSFKNRGHAVMMMGGINKGADIQAAQPTIQIELLLNNVGSAFDIMNVLSIVILAIAALGIFISLFNKLEERKKDIALIRVMGANRWFVFTMILGEGILTAIISFILGLGISKALLVLVNYMNQKSVYHFDLWIFTDIELYVFLLSILIGIIAALLPSIKVYRMQITNIIRHD